MKSSQQFIHARITLPVYLWESIQSRAEKEGRDFSEMVKNLLASLFDKKEGLSLPKNATIFGLWKGVQISDSLLEEAEESLFSHGERHL